MVNQFGKNAGKYVTSKGHAKGKDMERLFEIEEHKNSSLLDIATGGGHVANKLALLFKNELLLI